MKDRRNETCLGYVLKNDKGYFKHQDIGEGLEFCKDLKSAYIFDKEFVAKTYSKIHLFENFEIIKVEYVLDISYNTKSIKEKV